MSETFELMTEFAKEMAKLLPVKDIYEDAAQPAARQTGEIGGDLMKVVHLALAPIQVVAAYQDRFRNFINNSVRKVPEERRISPAPQIAGPVLEGIRYEPEGTEIDEMFANLLAHAMDRQTVGVAHPAYPNLIKQLSRDEAVCLTLMFDSKYTRILEADLDEVLDSRDNNKQVFTNHRVIQEGFPIDRLFIPERLNFYIDHLHSLGLAGLYRTDVETLYDTMDSPNRRQTGTRETSAYQLTSLGKDFIVACRPPVQKPAVSS